MSRILGAVLALFYVALCVLFGLGAAYLATILNSLVKQLGGGV